ncbi:hypothetical protein DERP_000534 [Dermatophagoides pteronyssinus]|uniref:Uncharacterized protein n=1 Tax=Dermatophagoides pteronyssinus TaxID=6956 RepID=A0ABQ8J0G4_DERPT|nr:hypothetical protein DERP_000534 [Dermatophagoides pteronyssinus]
MILSSQFIVAKNPGVRKVNTYFGIDFNVKNSPCMKKTKQTYDDDDVWNNNNQKNKFKIEQQIYYFIFIN